MKNIIITISLVALLLSCESNTTSNGGHEEHEEHADAGNFVTLTQEQMKVIDLTLTNIEDKNMSLDVIVNGSIEIPPQYMADISPVMGGVVKNIYVIEGDKVKKGQTLATLQHPDFIEMQNEYSNNLNEFEYIEKEYVRQEKLNKEKVVSDKSFQKITAEYKTLKSTIQAQKIKLQMVGISVSGVESGKIYSTVSIVSPFNGFISAIETNIGSFVQPQSKLFEVVNNNELHADFMVYEKDISKIEVGQKIFFTTSSLGQEFEAEIHNISPVFEENPKALHVHADIVSEKGKLIPGMYINGRLLANNVETRAVLSQAVISDKGKSYIFIKVKKQSEVKDHGHEHTADGGHTSHKEDNNTYTFKKVEVIVGVNSGGFTEITPTIKVSNKAQVVANGAYFVLSELTKEENEHSH